MNYRHIYHAGNLSDVPKHSVLTLLLEHMQAKEKGFTFLDTHASIGLYDLQDERAAKEKKSVKAIHTLMQAPEIPELAGYYKAIKSFNSNGALRYYPGSVGVAFHKLRPQDSLIACELHPEDARDLRRNFGRNDQVHIHERDGYEAMAALLPPPTKRALIFIDPPFEKTDELETLTKVIKKTYERFSTGVYAIWYPVKERPTIWRWHEAMIAAGIKNMLAAEFIFHPDVITDRLNGTGMLIINPPWQFDKKLEALFPKLHAALGTEHPQSVIKWLAPE